jgi:diguanylate cyclase (GGDEF)-like protein/PAS domain S-box-containing protein
MRGPIAPISPERLERLDDFLEMVPDAMVIVDDQGTIWFANRQAEQLLGYRRDDLVGERLEMLVAIDREDTLRAVLKRVLQGEHVDELETIASRQDARPINVAVTLGPIRGPGGEVIGAAVIARDITMRVRYREQLQFLAEHDALTGAANRRRLERDIADHLARARRYGEHAALLIMDVDGLKAINDRHGHHTGDAALKAVVAALRHRLRETDTVARIGGDEFAVLLPYATREQAELIAESLRATIGERSVAAPDGTPLELSVSIGIVTIDAHSDSEETVLVEADRAMYRDKARAGGTPASALSRPA